MLKFITGNKDKFNEVKEFLEPIKLAQSNIDLLEIQSSDAREIIAHKLHQSLKLGHKSFIVEDTSLYLECFNYKFPGPFIKWLLASVGPKGISITANKLGKTKAYVVSIFGYCNSNGKIKYFLGKCQGRIVSPKGTKDFGWGAIFLPNGSNKTFGQMDKQEKFKFSMRGQAAKKLKSYLLN